MQSTHDACFDTISRNLKLVGALTVEEYLDIPHSHGPVIEAAPASQLSVLQQAASTTSCAQSTDNIQLLIDMCQKHLGSMYPPSFDLFDENNGTGCILTILRPSTNKSRSYRTVSPCTSAIDAKKSAADLAIRMGALEFITTDDSGLVSLADPPTVPLVDVDSPIKKMEDCCLQFERPPPAWFPLSMKKPKLEKKYGFALRVKLSPHRYRVYCPEVSWSSATNAAKLACAQYAIDKGVLDFITDDGQPSLPSATATVQAPACINLQTYYEALPRPFPEPIDESMSAEQVNGVQWFTNLLNANRGIQLQYSFCTIERSPERHGCLLRLEQKHEGDVRVFLVEDQFLSRSDAKAAVCLLAMSQGFGEYVRTLSKDAASRVSPELISYAHTTLATALSTACQHAGSGWKVKYQSIAENDGFGCRLVIESPTMVPTSEWTAVPTYRNKHEAKAVAICLAVSQGALELLRFRGGLAAVTYVPHEATRAQQLYKDLSISPEKRGHKRKLADPSDKESGEPSTKRQRTESTQARPSSSKLPPARVKPAGKISTIAERDPPPHLSLSKTSQLPHAKRKSREPATIGTSSSQSLQLDPRAARAPLPYDSLEMPPPRTHPPSKTSTSGVPLVKTASTNSGGKQSAPPKPTTSISASDSVSNSSSKPHNGQSSIHREQIPSSKQATKPSRVAELYAYCDKQGVPRPQFHHELIPVAETQASVDGVKPSPRNKVWAISGTERLELPVTFASINEGRERVARQVLARLKARQPPTAASVNK